MVRPEAFDEDVVPPCAFTIHADLDVSALVKSMEVNWLPRTPF
jgi:hypothetical protein